MLFSSAKKNHERAVKNYDAAVAKVQNKCDAFNSTRNECVLALERIESIINSITHTPRKITKQAANISIERVKYRDTESFTKEAVLNAVGSAALAAIGVGAAIAGLKARNPIFRVIMFFISLFSGIFSIFSFRKKDKKTANDANNDAKQLNAAAAHIRKQCVAIAKLHNKTNAIYENLSRQVALAEPLFGRDFKSMSRDERTTLGNIVRNAVSLATVLNRTIEK